MIQKAGWGWKTYLIFYTIVIMQTGFDFFSEESALNTFFKVMIAFNKGAVFVYYIDMITVIINVVCLLPLFLYIYQKTFLPPLFWKALFFIRILFDMSGHAFERAFLKSVFYNDLFTFAKLILMIILISAPSYLIHYLYAFNRNKIIPPQKELFA